MSFKIDERGSKDQRILYTMLTEIYSNHDVVYEQAIPDLNQRIDLFVPHIGLAIEYQGIQHEKFVPHFHKNIEEFKRAVKMDQVKSEYLYMHGIKLVYIYHDKMVSSKEELSDIIDKTPYPDGIEMVPFETVSQSRKDFLESQRESRKETYQKVKALTQEDSDIKKVRLLKERQYRQEQYQKIKKVREEKKKIERTSLLPISYAHAYGS